MENAAGIRIDGDADPIGGDGIGEGKPIAADTDGNGIGLRLETPAGVIVGPVEGEEIP